MGARAILEISVPSAQFGCEPKVALNGNSWWPIRWNSALTAEDPGSVPGLGT